MNLTSNCRSSKTWAEISLQNLSYNYTVIREKLHSDTPHCKMLCVVKADAYGHGAVPCVQTLAKEGAEWFGVSSVSEALQVREALGKQGEILILGYTLPSDLDLLVRYHITQTLISLEYAIEVSQQMEALKKEGKIHANETLKVHLKIDTGMNRIGFSSASSEWDRIRQAYCLPHLDMEGIFTHFACSDEPEKELTRQQYQRFQAVLQYCAKNGLQFRLRHVCNSAAILNYPEMHLDMVRCGLTLYGLIPSPQTQKIDLRPVMALKTVISHIHEIAAGETVSYGAIFTAEKKMRIATLPVGYADGFLRAFAKGGMVSIHGQEVPLVGRICMDQCMADISDMEAEIGQEVLLFGEENRYIDHLSAIADTINYEIVCLVGKRVPRVYSMEGNPHEC